MENINTQHIQQGKTSEEIIAQQGLLIADIQAENKELRTQNQELEATIAVLSLELKNLKKLLFGSKTERFIHQDNSKQLSINLLPAENTPEPSVEQNTEALQTINYQRKNKVKPENKIQPKRSLLPAGLPRKEIIIHPEGDLSGATIIGQDITEIYEYQAGKYYVTRIIRPKYLLPGKVEEGKENLNSEIRIADLPVPFPKSNLSASLAAHILINKYVYHLPLYRQLQIMKQEGLEIPDSTMGGWVSQIANNLEILYDKLVEQIHQSHYLQGDETPIQVLTHDKPGASHKGYMFVYRANKTKLVLFEYQKGRGREGPSQLLKNFSGALQTDGYAVYDIFETYPSITLLACMAHARRKFHEAQENDPLRAQAALQMFAGLYEIEAQARETGLSDAQRYELRQKEAAGKLLALEQWLKKEQALVLPKSAIGKAIAYTLRLWTRLIRYLENGAWEIDNNLVENSIRPIALGRKNYLFCGSHDAAQSAAMFYTFIASCKMNGIDPKEWLENVLNLLPTYSAKRLYELLPNYYRQFHLQKNQQ